jgi:Zn-dependent oligopeptidase
MAWLEPIVRAAPPFEINKEKTMNLLTLLDNRTILEYVKEEIIPKITAYKNQIYETYQLLSFFDDVGQSILELTVEDKPSKRVEDLLEKYSASLLEESE